MDENDNPILLELFCGTGGVSRSFRERGYRAYGVDWDERFDCEMHADIGALSADDGDAQVFVDDEGESLKLWRADIHFGPYLSGYLVIGLDA
jgi:hypothetical protein